MGIKSVFGSLRRLPMLAIAAISIFGLCAQSLAAADQTLLVASSANWTKDIDKQLAEKFTKETGIKIDFQLSPDDQYSNVLKTKFAAGEGPDVYLLPAGAGMIEFQPEQHAVDLSSEPWVARYTDWAKAGALYKGKVVLFNTWSVDGWGLLYNPALFKLAGIKKVPATFQDFVKACDALKAKGITPIYQPGKDEWHQGLWLNALGPQAAKASPGLYANLNENKATYASQKGFETGLAQLKSLNDKGYFGDNVLDNTWANSYQAMASGKYAMMLVYSTYQNEVVAADPKSKADTWEMFPVPLNDNIFWATSAGGIGRSINNESKMIDAAKKYFGFLSRADNLKAYYAARKDLSAISFKDVTGETTPAFKSVMKNSAGGSAPDLQGGTTFFDLMKIGKVIQELYLGIQTPKTALETIDSQRAKMFE